MPFPPELTISRKARIVDLPLKAASVWIFVFTTSRGHTKLCVTLQLIAPATAEFKKLRRFDLVFSFDSLAMSAFLRATAWMQSAKMITMIINACLRECGPIFKNKLRCKQKSDSRLKHSLLGSESHHHAGTYGVGLISIVKGHHEDSLPQVMCANRQSRWFDGENSNIFSPLLCFVLNVGWSLLLF